MKILNTRIPLKIWGDDIEEGALEQAKHLTELPFAYHHIAIMPDVHQGYGMPIGGVMATEGVIVPNAVGVDIACGVCAVKTSLTDLSKDTLKKIMGNVREAIPVGFKKHKEEQDENLMPKKNKGFKGVIDKEYHNALRSLGTLGGGNHFIEIQKGSDGYIWIMVHSGSRNLGLKVANHYNKLAIEFNKKYPNKVPKEWDLAFLLVDSEEGQAYIKEMNYCIEFALANRKVMMDRIKKNIEDVWNDETGTSLVFDEMINIAHNYASLEKHFGKDVWVHRKGATLAEKGTIGIVPGNQGAKSYIVEGLGNPESFNSCSHGAGRLMSRHKARAELDLEAEKKILDDQGVIHGVRNVRDLDEAPSAYKDIDEVMENQKDLVKIKV